MLVSIILISYNQSAYLRETVESVFAQSHSDWELIAIDNGSTDGSKAILQGYAAKDSRVRVFLHDENGSISHRFNEGIDAAKGAFISFLYSDDCYLPTKLAHQLALFDKLGDGYGVVYAPAIRLDVLTGKQWRMPTLQASGFILERMLRDGLQQGTIDMLSPMLRRRCVEKHRFYDDLFAEGESFYYRLALTERFFYDDTPVVVLREHEHNLGKATKFNVQTLEVICRRLAAHPDFPSTLRGTLREYETVLLRNGGWCVIRTGGDLEWARGAIVRSLRLTPASFLNPRVLGGLALSYLPSGVRARLNALGHSIRRLPNNKINVELDRSI